MVIAAAPLRLESPTTTATTASTTACSVNGARVGSSTIDTRKTSRRLSTGTVPDDGPVFESDAQLQEFLTLLQPPTTPTSLHSRKKKVVNSGGVLRSFTNMFKRTGGGNSKCESKHEREERLKPVLALTPSQFPSVEANEVFQEIHRQKETSHHGKALPVLTVTDLRGKSMVQKTLSHPSLEMNRSCATNPASLTQASTTNRTVQWDHSLHQSVSTPTNHITGNPHDTITLPPPSSVSARRNGTSDSVSLLSAGNERHHLHRAGSVTSRSRSHGPRDAPPNLPVELETNSERAKRRRSEANHVNNDNNTDGNPSIDEGEEYDNEEDELRGNGQNIIDRDVIEQLLGAPHPYKTSSNCHNDTVMKEITVDLSRNELDKMYDVPSVNKSSTKQNMSSSRPNRTEAPLYPSLQEFPPPPVFNEPRAEVEISPGFYLPLRGSRETLWAIQHGQIATTTCVCGLLLHCVQDAAFVLCPDCRVIGPMEYHGDSSLTPEGVGLGFKPEQLAEWRVKD